MVEEARLRPASGIALQRPVVATLSGQEVGDFDPARGGGFCPANGALQNLTTAAPIYVVPGALAGHYKPGLNDEVLKNNARYWTGLLTNVTRKSAAERLGELENFADNSFLVGYQKLRDQMLAEVEQQSQGRTFVEKKDSATLRREPDGTYTFTVSGDRMFFSAGIVLFEDQAIVEWHFKIGSPSAKNQYGLTFLGVDVRVVPGSKKTS